MELEELSKKIIDYRARHNISQFSFALECNVSPQTICNIERVKQKPSKLTLQKILNVIGE